MAEKKAYELDMDELEQVNGGTSIKSRHIPKTTTRPLTTANNKQSVVPALFIRTKQESEEQGRIANV